MSFEQAVEQLRLIDDILSNQQLSNQVKISHLEMLRFPLKHVQSITMNAKAKTAKQRKKQSKKQKAINQNTSNPRMRDVRGARIKDVQYRETSDYGEDRAGQHILGYPVASAWDMAASTYDFGPRMQSQHEGRSSL